MNNIKMNYIVDFLKSKNIDVVGFTQINNKYNKIPAGFSPLNLSSKAKSIICFAIPIPQGIIYASNHADLLYWRYCNTSYRFLDMVAQEICLILESRSFPSTPIYSCYPWKVIDQEFWGLLPLIFWAEQTGIGKLTKSGLLGNPNYGTRLLLGGVLTTEIFPQSKLIEKEICPSDCYECINSCPAKAIEKNGKVDHNLCIRYANSNPLLKSLLKNKEIKNEFSFEIIMNTVGVDDHGSYHCFECLKICPLNR